MKSSSPSKHFIFGWKDIVVNGAINGLLSYILFHTLFYGLWVDGWKDSGWIVTNLENFNLIG
ncbi:unnamed protein product [Cunninghamella echinulata]